MLAPIVGIRALKELAENNGCDFYQIQNITIALDAVVNMSQS